MRGNSLRLEAVFWGALLLLAGSFAMLALAASRDYELAIDERVTFAVQGWYVHAWADPLFNTANRLSEVAPLLVAAGALSIALLVRRRILEAAVVAMAMLPALILHWSSVSVERPDEIFNAMRATFDGLIHPRIYPSPDGFPSGHVFGVVLVYGLVAWLVPRVLASYPATLFVRLACLGITVAGFLAPMYSGYHWFTDCLGGAILGAIVLLLAWRLLLMLQPDRELVRVQDLMATPARRSRSSTEWTRTRS
jgi:membrane-associated phospholipid phosphatase